MPDADATPLIYMLSEPSKTHAICGLAFGLVLDEMNDPAWSISDSALVVQEMEHSVLYTSLPGQQCLTVTSMDCTRVHKGTARRDQRDPRCVIAGTVPARKVVAQHPSTGQRKTRPKVRVNEEARSHTLGSRPLGDRHRHGVASRGIGIAWHGMAWF